MVKLSVTHVDDVAAILGRPIVVPESEQVKGWIERVEGRIRRRIVDLDERLDDADYAQTFTGVVVDVVVRKVLNPTGMKSERIDDYYYDRGGAPADLWPTAEEWAELLPTVGGGAFSTRPGFVPGRAKVWFG